MMTRHSAYNMQIDCPRTVNLLVVSAVAGHSANNSAKNVGGVTVVNLCMSSGHALY